MNTTTTNEYRLKGLYNTSGTISRRTLIESLKLFKKCKTIGTYTVVEDGTEKPAEEWLKENTNYGKRV